MTDSQFAEFLTIFNDRVREARIGETEIGDVIPVNPREIAFTEVFLGDLVDIGQVGDLEVVYFEHRLGRANAKLNAYAISEVDAHVDLVVTLTGEEGSGDLGSVAPGEIGKAIKAALHVFRAAKDPLHEKMEPASAAHDMVERLYVFNSVVTTIRLMVLIEGQIGKVPAFDQPDDLPKVNVDIWDLERLYRAASSGLTYESVTINLSDILGAPLPLLSASKTADDHECHFAVFPGELLHDLYHEHGPRLLELNVRSFLQARGKVNRGIRDTLHNDPGHFLAYNNGISATVEELVIVTAADGSKGIDQIKGLQIVNGGQTVASIHRAKDRDKIDLSKVQVAAKITVVDPKHVDDLVPLISRYSNTQNKVNETDFSANHPFHVKIQQLSARVWAPGEMTRWFYERARGQWEVARIREGNTPARKRTFDQKTPRSQKVDKNLLAKAYNAWDEQPHIVSLGGQKCFVGFMTRMAEMPSTWEPDEDYYKDLIAKIIIFKRAEKIARQIKFSAYRANAVCYTVASLAFRTASRVNQDKIWDNQDVSSALEDTMRDWMPRIHEEIVESAGDRNVTEWAKKKDCWANLQSLALEFAPGFEDELAEGQPLPTVGKFSARKGATPKDMSTEERERQAKVMRLSSEEWHELVKWMSSKCEYEVKPLPIAQTVLGYAAGGWKQVPSPNQTRHLVDPIESWENAIVDTQ